MIFITQGRYTGEAMTGMVAKPEDRSKALAKLVKAAGGKLIGHYLTFGEYDFLSIVEAPDEKTAASAVIAAAAGGGVTGLRTTVAMNWTDAKNSFAGAKELVGSFKAAGDK